MPPTETVFECEVWPYGVLQPVQRLPSRHPNSCEGRTRYRQYHKEAKRRANPVSTRMGHVSAFWHLHSGARLSTICRDDGKMSCSTWSCPNCKGLRRDRVKMARTPRY